MIDIIDNILGAFILVFTLIYAWKKTINAKINYKDKKFYITLFSIMLASILNYYFVNPLLKLFILPIIMIIFCNYLFKIGIKKSIILVIITQIILILTDAVVTIILASIFGANSYVLISALPKTLINILASIVLLILFLIPLTKRLYNIIFNKTNKIKATTFIYFSLVILTLSNIIAVIIYSKYDFRLLIIFNTIYTVFCFFIVIYLYKIKDNYIKVYDKFNVTLNSLKEYEDILDRYRISNHENKNQLLTIRNMISQKDKKIISYIDQIIENKLKDNDKVMFETSIIPTGGLRGLIYSKILVMKNLKINYELEISKGIRTVDLISIDEALMLDVCQIIGVYLDNAIEATRLLKEKHINIEMYINDSELVIEITNNYEGEININKIDEIGYSTKGKGHGYGLTLTKEIIDKNKKLSNFKKMSNNYFTQILKIKM